MFKVNEIFETIQGEGVFTGVPSIFIRLQGCPVGCAWCDTKHTWDIDMDKEITFSEVVGKSQESDDWGSIDEIQLHVFCQKSYTSKHIVITGGEPCMYNLRALTELFENDGYTCQIETSGTFDVITSEQTWVTVSPKVGMKGKLSLKSGALSRANEIKHPVGTQKDIDNLHVLLKQHQTRNDVVVALQPISQKERATALCMKECIENNWRLSVQVHKYLNIA